MVVVVVHGKNKGAEHQTEQQKNDAANKFPIPRNNKQHNQNKRRNQVCGKIFNLLQNR